MAVVVVVPNRPNAPVAEARERRWRRPVVCGGAGGEGSVTRGLASSSLTQAQGSASVLRASVCSRAELGRKEANRAILRR